MLGSSRLIRTSFALAALVVLLGIHGSLIDLVKQYNAPAVPLAQIGALIVIALPGIYAIRQGRDLIFKGLDPQAAVTTRNLVSWVLYVLLAIVVAQAVGINLSGFLVGGAILGVVVAAAAQASLGNFFAGLVLMVGRPYRMGAAVRLRSNQVGGAEYEGTVVDMNALYTSLRTARGELLHLPNSAVVSSAMVVGRPPLQARIDVELPPGTALEPLRETLEKELDLPPSTVTVIPSKLQAGDDPKLTCEIEVRASRQVEPGLLADALAGALATMKPVPISR
jgi:small-conductance mechanosensitive channel